MKSLLILSTNELLKKGSQGAKVAQLQRILTDLKFNPGEIDGDFGNKTVAAVQQFQKQQGITADGIVGKQTQNALNKALENLTSTPNKTEEKARLLRFYIILRRRVTTISRSLIFLRRVLRLMPSKSAHLAWLPEVAASEISIKGTSISRKIL